MSLFLSLQFQRLDNRFDLFHGKSLLPLAQLKGIAGFAVLREIQAGLLLIFGYPQSKE